MAAKTERIDVRVEPVEKQEIKRPAKSHKTDVSSFLLAGAKFLKDNPTIAEALLKQA